jgi:phosphate transport system protein
MERHFHEQLAELKKRLVLMGTLVEEMIAHAAKALTERDEALAATVYETEKTVNQMQVEIDETCFRLTALQQPAARDLRFILGTVKTNSDLERLADEAVNICNKSRRLMRSQPLRSMELIPPMIAIAREMVRDSLDSFVNVDPVKARRVLVRDDAVDQRKAEITAVLMEQVAREPAMAKPVLDLILMARNIERIADHATNIAENVIFVAEGCDVRHHHAP